MDAITELRKLVLLPNGKPRRGAISRCAEKLGVSWRCVRNWLDGKDQRGTPWTPGKKNLQRLEDMLEGKIDLSPRKTGRKI